MPVYQLVGSKEKLDAVYTSMEVDKKKLAQVKANRLYQPALKFLTTLGMPFAFEFEFSRPMETKLIIGVITPPQLAASEVDKYMKDYVLDGTILYRLDGEREIQL